MPADTTIWPEDVPANRPGEVPRPVPVPIDEGMWRAAAEGRLAVQQCSACGSHRYPPTVGCPKCGDSGWTWSTLPGTGTVVTYVWIPDPTRAAIPDVPASYNVAIVALDGVSGGPVRIASNVLDAWEPEDLAVGQRVRLACVPLADGVGLPCFRRAMPPL